MLTFNQTVSSVSNSLRINDVQAEVDALIDMSRNDIALFGAVEEWLANKVGTLPCITEGTVVVKFRNARGWDMFKTQDVSPSVWIISMQQLQFHGAVNADLIAASIANWVNDSCYTEFENLGRKEYASMTTTKEASMWVAKKAIEAMQQVGIVNNTKEKKVVRLQAGNNITVKAYNMADSFRDELNDLIVTLRERVVMKCAPLTYKPMDWTDSRTGIAEGAGLKLITGSRTRNKHIAPKVLEAVNKLQRVKFTVAPCILEAAKDMKLNGQLYKGDNLKSMFSDKELNSEAFDVYRELETLQGKEFYFPVTMDKRGRMYYRGGLLSPQGVDFCKAAFQFASFKPLGLEGFRALCIHAANTLGCDKESIKGREKFVKDNWQTIMAVNTHMDIRKHFKADVFQALVVCKELQRLDMIEGEWSEKTSNLVCHQDGTCNGLQHMAAITGDRPTAEAVNCVASTYDDAPADIYDIVAREAARIVEDDSVRMLILKYGRDMAKNPVMVTGYGATESTIIRNTRKFLAQKGEDITKAKEVGIAYLDAISNKAGAVTQLTDAIKNRMEYAIAEGQKSFTWRTADGFIASTCYEDFEPVTVRVGQSMAVRMRGMGKSPIDAMKTAQAMSPNFVHSIDSTHIRMIVCACDFELVTVHDSIGSHPCDFFETGRMIREKYTLLHKGYNALEDLCEHIGQSVPEFPVENDYDAAEALQSAYIFS